MDKRMNVSPVSLFARSGAMATDLSAMLGQSGFPCQRAAG
jgi:hypothetical protein